MYRLKGLAKRYNLVIWAVIICFLAANILFMPFSPFVNKASAATYNITVDYNTVVQTLDQYFNGVNYVAFWDNDQGSTGSREALRRAGIKRIRFPGGEPANWYDWSRPTSWSTTRPLDMWNYAKAVGACVMFQTNPTTNGVGDGFYNDPSGTHAADWVTWAKNNGVNCPVWEVGNEPDINLTTANDYTGFQWYTDRFNEQAPAMKSRDSSIKVSGGVLTNAWYWWGLNTLEMFQTKCGTNADSISIHWYGSDYPTFDNTKGFAQSWQNNWNFIRTKTSKPIYVTEWNSMGQNTGTYGRTIGLAVANADVIGAFAKTGVAGHCYFGNIHLVDNNWGMFYNASEGKPLDTPTPAYYMLPLWSKMGDQVLNATHNADAANTLNAWTHKKSDGSVQVMVINKSGANTVNISFNGFNPTGKTVNIYELMAKNGAVSDTDIYYNGVLNPNASTADLPGPLTASCPGATFSRSIPAYSVTVFDFPAQQQAVDIKTECENGTLTSWNIDSNQSSASGGKAIISTAAGNQATFSINIPSSGTYRLYINNSIGAGGWSRTTHMDVDSTSNVWTGTLPAANANESWNNFRLTDLGTATLTAGTHTFKIRHDYYDGYEHLYDYFRLVKQ